MGNAEVTKHNNVRHEGADSSDLNGFLISRFEI